MTMFKFRRPRGRNNPAADDDDDEMRGTSFKRGVPAKHSSGSSSNSSGPMDPPPNSALGGRGAMGRPLPGFEDHQHRHRSSSHPGSRENGGGKPTNLRNYSSNTRNKSSGHRRGGSGPSSKVSWVSDTEETDVTETWVSDMYSSHGSDDGSSCDQGSADGGSRASSRISEASGEYSESQGEYSRESGDYSRRSEASGEYSHETSSGYSEHDEEGSSQDSGPNCLNAAPGMESEESLFSPGERKKAVLGGGKKYQTDEEASYESVGDQVQKSPQSKDGKKISMPPPPPQRKNSTGGTSMNDSSASLGAHSKDGSRGRGKKGDSKKSNGSSGNRGKKEGKNNNKDSGRRRGRSPTGSVGTKNTNATKNTAATGPSQGSQGRMNNAPPTRPGEHQEEQRMKPPSMKGMMPQATAKMKAKSNQRRASSEENKSVASAPHASSGATVATSASDGARKEAAAAGDTEVAAMQQLAYLVVSLRSDLREANLARDELESKVEDLEKNQTPKANDANPYSDDSKLKELEKENAELQADVDSFLLEQDDLKAEIRQLNEDKSSLNDIISRLKRDQSAAVKGVGADARIQELTEENHKLEREIQLLVGEKSQLVSSSDSRSCEIEQLHKNLKEGELRLQEKERMAGGMLEKIDSLEGEVERLEKECREGKMDVALLEDDLERKEGEADTVRAELQSESKKMTLLRQRLSQVEKQKAEVVERNAAMDGVMMGLKKKTEEMLKERNATRQAIKELKEENQYLSDELESERKSARQEAEQLREENHHLSEELILNSSKAIAKEAAEADTLLSLQKMIASLEEAKDQLEDELDRREAEAKLDAAKITELETKLGLNAAEMSQLESKLRVAQELGGRRSSASGASSASLSSQSPEDASGLEKRVAELTAANQGLRSKVEGLEEEQDAMEDEFDSLKECGDNEVAALNAVNESLQNRVRTLENEQIVIKAELERYKKNAARAGGAEGEEEEVLKERIAELTTQNEELQSKIKKMEDERATVEDELKLTKQSSATAVADLQVSLDAKESSFVELANTKSTLSSQNQTIARLQKTIARLEEEKGELDEEMNEATDAIAMLEDELDDKDAQVKELLVKITMLQQQLSQVDKCKTALAERNAKLSSDNDGLSTQIKVLNIEKKVAREEIDTLKELKTIADEDQEEALIRKEESQQEVDMLMEKFESMRAKNSEKINELEQEVYSLEEQNMKLVQDLDEGNDALTMLREALKEMEAGKVRRDATIKDLKSELAEKEVAVTTLEAVQNKLQSEHQVSVDTIANLQKMISSLEKSKVALEEELDASSAELLELKEQLNGKNMAEEVKELEGKLNKATEEKATLSQRIADLKEVNKKMKDQVKDLGDSLAKVTMKHDVLQGSVAAPTSSSRALVSNDPVSTCDSLIDELKNQIKEIVSARNAALEEVEYLKGEGASVASKDTRDGSHSTKTIPPPAEIDTSPSKVSKKAETSPLTPVSVLVTAKPKPATAGFGVRKCKSSSELLQLDDSGRSDPSSDGDEPSTSTKTIEKSLGPSVANTSAPSHAGSRGSSLLEAAKKLCDQLEEKRSQEASEKMSNNSSRKAEAAAAAASSASKHGKGNGEPNKPVVPQWEEEPVKNVADQDDDNTSAKEVKEDSPKDNEKSEAKAKPTSKEEEKKQDNMRSSSRSKGRFDIDQLTSIYFEKCGMSVSKFSDLSSDSSSFRRRRSTGPNNGGGNTVTKKVKICRNGVFMGTYEGDLNPDGQRHGFGVLLCDNGNSYEGEWKKDKRDGLGIARYSSGDVYDGQWQRGKRQGHGVMYIEAGDTYIGSWNNGLKHGAGTYHWADGEVDVSWYQEDRRVGEGVRWNASRSKAFRLIRGTKKEELSLDEAYMTAEKLGLNLEKFDSGVP